MNKPVIELKNLQVQAKLSDETPCYTAKLYVDGKHYANVSNHGHGAPDLVDLVAGHSIEDFRALDAQVGQTYPKTVFQGIEILESIETLCHIIAFRSLEMKSFTAKLKRSVLIVKDGEVYTLKGKKSDLLVEAAAKRYGADNVLNLKTAEEAFKIFAKED